MSSHRYLHISVEVAARELESKLLLALFAYARGFSVLLGEDDFFTRNMERLPRGIFFDKSFTRNHLRNNILPAKRAGHLFAAIDEEGCESRDDPMAMARFDLESLDLADLIFVWGEDQAARIADRSPKNRDKIVVTGSQRWDLLRPEGLKFYTQRVAALRELFGDYILVNSNFSLTSDANAYDSLLEAVISNGSLDPEDPEQIARLERRRDYQAACMNALIEGVRGLAKAVPDRNIVYRPHPVELIAPWQEVFEDLNNVHVIRHGPPEPWMLASRLLVVSGCTTGMQAITMGQPAVTYALDDDPEFRDDSLTNHVCPRANSLSSFLEICGRLLNDPAFQRAERERGMAELSHFVAALEGPYAAVRMANAFDNLVDGNPVLHHKSSLDLTRTKLKLKNRKPNNIKFPDITQDEIVSRLGELSTAFGIGVSPGVSPIREKVFLIS